jgi:8-oxo-dGTP pyrophosphatase MutT (NUDIX family)
MVVQPRLAAAVMLLRDSGAGPQVFMVRRSLKSEFMPDVYVFPGGTVSADDLTTEAASDLCRPVSSTLADPEGRTSLGRGIRVAAIRELFEEANIFYACSSECTLLALNETSLARFADYRRALNERRGDLVSILREEHLVLATDILAYYSHWVTPERSLRRYDTHFFLAPVPPEQVARYDAFETSAGVWIRPVDALQQFEDGIFPLAFPTVHQLRELVGFVDVSSALAVAAERYVVTYKPYFAEVDGREMLLI